jgi:chromosome segregation ATPase
MPGNTPDIGIKVHIEELQRFKSQVSSLDQTTEQLKKQFEGVSTSQEELSSIQKSLNNLISSYKTQVDKNGNVTTSAAKKMLAEYEKLLNAVEELDEAERKRLSQSEYEAEMQKLTGRNSRLALAKGATTRLTKQASALEAENAQISSLSGFALKKKASKGAVNYIREGNIRRGEGRGGGLSKNQKEQLEDLGASKEIIEEINRLILEQNAALDENKRKQEDIKQELKEQQGIIREENDKVDNLKKQGVKTPGTSSFTEAIGRNIPDNVDAIHDTVNNAEETGKANVNLGEAVGKTEKATNKLTKSLINYNIVLQAFKRL